MFENAQLNVYIYFPSIYSLHVIKRNKSQLCHKTYWKCTSVVLVYGPSDLASFLLIPKLETVSFRSLKAGVRYYSSLASVVRDHLGYRKLDSKRCPTIHGSRLSAWISSWLSLFPYSLPFQIVLDTHILKRLGVFTYWHSFKLRIVNLSLYFYDFIS